MSSLTTSPTEGPNVNLDDLDWDRPDLDCKASKRWASLAIFAWTRQCDGAVAAAGVSCPDLGCDIRTSVATADTPTDLAILDIAMPRMTGLQAAREISRTHPHVRILILSMFDNEQYFFEALKAGASGYVLKSVADRDLLEACRATMRGEPFLYAGAVTALIRDYLHRARRGDALPTAILTPREEEVVKLIAEGDSARVIAKTLGISAKTVDRHRANILQKLGLRDRLALTRYAIRAGLIEP